MVVIVFLSALVVLFFAVIIAWGHERIVMPLMEKTPYKSKKQFILMAILYWSIVVLIFAVLITIFYFRNS